MPIKKYFFEDYSVGYYIGRYITAFLFSILLTIPISLIFGYNYFIINGYSSLPDLKYRSLVVTESVEIEDVNIGDYLTFSYSEENYITHRVVEVHDDYVLTQQTNGGMPDSPVYAENIKGRVVLHIGLFADIYAFVFYMQNGYFLYLNLVLLLITLIYALKLLLFPVREARYEA